jgi:hypothetical protein
MFLTTILLLQLVLLFTSFQEDLTSQTPSSFKQNGILDPSLVISLKGSSTLSWLSTFSSQSSILVDAGMIMSKMKRKMKDKKCTPEIVAIKKTRIVPVAVPVKSMSMPDSYATTQSSKGSSSYSPTSVPSSKKEIYVEEDDDDHEHDDDDDDIAEGTYADGGYNDAEETEGYEVPTHDDDYRRRMGDMNNNTIQFSKKMGQIMNDRIFRQTFDNPPIASNPLIDLLISRKNQADLENKEKYASSMIFANSFNHLQHRQDSNTRRGSNYEHEQQTPLHSDQWTFDQELR